MSNEKQIYNSKTRKINHRIKQGNFILCAVAILAFLTVILCVAIHASDSTGKSPAIDTNAAEGAGMAQNAGVYASPAIPENTPDAENSNNTENILIERIKDSEAVAGYKCPVTDWSGYDFTGFKEYSIPADYVRYGSAFPLCLQAYTYIKCREYGVDYALILAMIETESSYKPGAVSYDGKCKGFMQINPGFHADRMERIGAEDLFNPYDNIAVGVDFIAELLRKYEGNTLKALAAYNMGATGAYRNLWSKGIFEYSYTDKVTKRAERINNEIEKGNTQ